MPFEYITDTPLIRRLVAHDRPSQIALTQKLWRLNLQVMELLAQQPGFEAFVQAQFDQHFSALTPRLPVRKSYVQSRERLPATTAEMPLPPTLLDAVVQRIVAGEAATYASRDTLFLRAPDQGGDPQPVPALTAQAFDGFVDRLATHLSSHYEAFLHAYWQQPPQRLNGARTRRQALVDTRIKQLHAEVALLRNDEVLTAAGEALFKKVSRYPSAQSRRAFESYKPCVYGLALKGAALYGAFILTARDPEDAQVRFVAEVPAEPQVRPVDATTHLGGVLLFTPEGGLEEFDALASLDRELHRRLNHPVEFTRLLALMAEKHQPQGLALHREGRSSEQFSYLEWLDSPFSHSIEDQCAKLQEDFIATVARYQALPVQADRSGLPHSLDRVTDLERVFDASSILSARFRKRGQAQLKVFLENASNTDRLAWQAAIRTYCDELANLSECEGLPSFAQFSDRSVLLAYSHEQLRVLLETQFGLHADPDTIVIHTKEPRVPTAPFVPGAPGPGIRESGAPLYHQRKRSLTELALENVGGLDLNFTHFSRLTDPAGAPYTALNAGQVKDLVRTANVGNSYEALLKDRLVTSADAMALRSNFSRYLAQQVRLDALEAKIAGDFQPDRAHRGFNWVRVVLDQPEDTDRRETVEGHRILVQGLKLRGERVRGVWLFRTASAGVQSTVVYAPQAPGGRVFHEFSGDQLFSGFIFNSSWRDYLVGRVELAQQKRIRSILHGRGAYTMAQMPRIADNLFDEAYEVEANFAINNAAAQSTTTGETDIETATTLATVALDIATLVLPVWVMLPIGLARSLFSVFSAVDASSLGDRDEAAHYLVRALGEFTGALVDGVIGVHAGAPRPGRSFRGLNPQMGLKKMPDGLLELPGWNGKGIYYKPSGTGGPRQYFLNERNHWFSILDDGGEQAWRIRDVRKPHRYHHDPIRQDPQGRWEVGSHPGRGLRGGVSPNDELMTLYPFLDESQARRVFDSFNFPRGRELEFELSLVHALRAGMPLDGFHPYLMVLPERLLARVRGGDLPGQALIPIDPAPGTRQVARVRAPLERFADWGQTIDPVQLRLQHADQGLYQRIAGPAELTGSEYILIDQQYFPVLASGVRSRPDPNVVFMRDASQSLATYEQFELMLRRDLFDQPRRATFAGGDARWVNSVEMPFQKPLSSSIAEAFPMVTAASVVDIARALFNRANPSGLTARGIDVMQQTLRQWRQASAPGLDSLGEPLTLLRTPPSAIGGGWWLDNGPGQFTQMTYRTERIWLPLQHAVDSGSRASLKTLMSTVLTRDGYEVIASYAMPSELLFRRPAGEALYWLQLQRASGSVVRRSEAHAPSALLMDAPLRAQVGAARASNNLVPLVGGINRTLAGGTPSIFIIRV